MFYSAKVNCSCGEVLDGFVCSDRSKVEEWMKSTKTKHKMKDKRPLFFRRTHQPIFKNKNGQTLTCDFLTTAKF